MTFGLQALLPELVLQVVDRVFDNYADDIVRDRVREGFYPFDDEDESETIIQEDSEADSIDKTSDGGGESVKNHETPGPRRTVWRELANLSQTCRRLYSLVTPVLYRRDIELNYSSALLVSSRSGNLAAVCKSLDYGADPNMLDHTMPPCHLGYGDPMPELQLPKVLSLTALHWGTIRGHLDIVAVLLERGANVNQRADVYDCPEYLNPDAFTSQFSSAFGTCQKRCRYLRLQLSSSGANPLFFALSARGIASRYGALTELAIQLIDAGSSLITHRGFGIHAIHQAVYHSPPSFVEFLLREKATDADIRDGTGNTALHHFSRLSYQSSFGEACESACLLAQYGADLEAIDSRGRTAIAQAVLAKFPYEYVAFALLVAGAKLEGGLLESFKKCWDEECGDKIERLVTQIHNSPRGYWDPEWDWFLQ